MGLTASSLNLQPGAQKVITPYNYITQYDFETPYMPELDTTIFESFGDQMIMGFLEKSAAEYSMTSDTVKWSEDGRLETKYVNCVTDAAAAADTATITVNDTLIPSATNGIAVRPQQTGVIYANNGTGSNKFQVTDVDYTAGTFDVAYYEGGGQTFAVSTVCSVFFTGSEFKKGTTGMVGSLESYVNIFENTPIIEKDHFEVAGSDTAQIGWISVNDNQAGGTTYLWFVKSQNDTRKRFNNAIESSKVEAVPAATGSGVIALAAGIGGNKGMDGMFYSVETRGNVWSAGYPTTITDWQVVTKRQDSQGAVRDNLIWVNRDMQYGIDTFLSQQNSLGAGGTNWGAFNNSSEMGLKLGFKDWRLGSYYFYQTDWKYLNDATKRGNMPNNSGSGKVYGLMLPSGSVNVYENTLGSYVSRPYIHVRYRASEFDNRRYKVWTTGSVGAATDSQDVKRIEFLTERTVCTMGANNTFIFKA